MASFLHPGKDGVMKVGSVSAAITNDPKFSAALAAAINSVINSKENMKHKDGDAPGLACYSESCSTGIIDLYPERSSIPPSPEKTDMVPLKLDLAMAQSDQQRSNRSAFDSWNSG